MYALMTGGVPESKRLAVGDQSSVLTSNANGFARPNQPVTRRTQSLDQLSAHIQERDARNAHEELQIARRRESRRPSARTSTGIVPSV